MHANIAPHAPSFAFAPLTQCVTAPGVGLEAGKHLPGTGVVNSLDQTKLDRLLVLCTYIIMNHWPRECAGKAAVSDPIHLSCFASQWFVKGASGVGI